MEVKGADVKIPTNYIFKVIYRRASFEKGGEAVSVTVFRRTASQNMDNILSVLILLW